MPTGEQLPKIKEIEENLKDWTIDKQEINAINTAINFLKDPKNNTEVKEKITDKINTSKTKITESLQKVFIKDDQSIDNNKIAKLSPDQLSAYKNIIDRLQDNSLDTIKTAIDNKIQENKTNKEKKEQTEQDAQLFEILSAEPTKELARDMFEKNMWAWTALFRYSNNNKFILEPKITIDNTKYASAEIMQKNFTELVKKYLSQNAKTAEEAKEKEDSIQNIQIITATNVDSNYQEGEQYIQVTYKDKNQPKTDIMFGTNTDIIHQKRYEYLTVQRKQDIKENIPGDIPQALLDLDNHGAHITFKNIINDETIKPKTTITNSIDKDILKEIDTYYTTNKNVENKTNQYYTTITDMVCTEASKGNIMALKTYLDKVDAEHTKYLWTDPKTQIENYNKIVAYIKSPAFIEQKDTPVGKEIIGKVLWLQIQLKQAPLSFKETINKGVDSFFQSRGKVIVDVLEFFGGKGAVKKLFSSLGMEPFYQKNFQKIDENINKAYKEKFSLSEKANEIITDKNTFKEFSTTNFVTGNADQTPLTPTQERDQIQKGIDAFNANSKNQDELTTILKQDITLIDPLLAYHILTKNKVNNINDFVVKDASTGQRKINTQINEENQKFLVDHILKDPETLTNIKTANMKITGVKNEDNITREDLWDAATRKKYTIQSDKDVARYITAYAFGGSKSLDYVITENNITSIPEVIKEPQTKSYTTKNVVDLIDEKGKTIAKIPKDTDITAILDDKGEETKKTGKELGMTNSKLQKTKFIKVKYKNKGKDTEGYVAETSLQLKQASTEKKPDNSTTIKPDNNTTNTPTENKTQPTAQVTTPTENTNTSQTSNNTVQAVPQQNHNWETTTEWKSQQTKIEITQDVPQDNTILETKLDENTQLTFWDNFPETQKNTWNKYYTTSIMEFNTMVDVYQNLIDNELKGKTISDAFIQSIKKDFTEKRENIKKIEEWSDNYTWNITIWGEINFSDEAQQYKYNIKQNYLQQAVTCKIITQQEKDDIIAKETDQALNNILS